MIRLENIHKFYYTDAGVTQALRRVNLQFNVGEFVAITGESGSGKSTLLNVISGMDTFDEGEMFVQGHPTFHYDESDWEKYRRDTIGFVFQNYNLIGHYSALDNVVAALLIQGMEIEQARGEAVDYLEQVGLSEFMNQRASSLSSGQKQRLSIARALAKKTPVLVADEPTGNLDSKTGRAIVELLASLSKDRLVIMVTHNYDQAKPFITRKVRLHDGEVVADIVVEDGVEGGAYRAPAEPEPSALQEEKRAKELQEQQENELSENTLQDDGQSENAGVAKAPGTGTAGKKTSKSSKKNAKSDKKKSHFLKNSLNFFALHNIRTQPNRAGMFFAYFAMTALVSFLFLGELFIQSDDIKTRVYDSSAYLQENDCRLSVRHSDGSAITDKDIQKLRNVKYVESADAYDEVSDIRYYIDKDHDYKEVYSDQEEDETTNENTAVSRVEFLDDTHFMRSATAITKDDLKAGRLPEARGEIVMYSDDDKTLNQTLECYFTADNLWTQGQYYEKDLKVVGLLKKDTDQVYFQSDFCRMLLAGARGVSVYADYAFEVLYGKYKYNAVAVPVIGDDLKAVKNTDEYLPALDKFDDDMQYQLRFSENYATVQTGEQKGSQKSANRSTLTGLARMNITGYVDGKTVTKQLRADLQEDLTTKDSGYFVEIPEKLFWEMYDWDTDQAAVYISHYSKTKKVIAALDKLGYEAINSAQVSATQYDPSKVISRLVMVAISVLVLIFLAVIQVLILRAMLKVKIEEFYVLKFMGMQQHQLRQIVYRELLVYCMAAVIVVLIVTFGFNLLGVGLLYESYQYMQIPGILLFVVYNLILMWMTASAFCRQVKKRI